MSDISSSIRTTEGRIVENPMAGSTATRLGLGMVIQRPVRGPATARSVNEGGRTGPAGEAPPPQLTRARSFNKISTDTPDGCRTRATADLASAVLMDTENGRRRLEHSAATWYARADLIQRLDDSFAARQAAAAAMWAAGESPIAKGRRPAVQEPALGGGAAHVRL